MKTLFRLFRLTRDQRGATGMEYGLCAGLIGVAVLGALSMSGTNLDCLYAKTANALATGSAGTCPGSKGGKDFSGAGADAGADLGQDSGAGPGGFDTPSPDDGAQPVASDE